MPQTTILQGGVRHDTLALVQTDGLTVAGDGTAENPLRLSEVQIVASFFGETPLSGTPVFAIAAGLPPVASVVGISAAGGTRSEATVVGLVGAPILVSGGGEPGRSVFAVQYDGRLRQSTTSWDAITGGIGGLAPGPYYVGPLPGTLTRTPSAVSGAFVSQVGIALDAETIALSIPSVPRQNP
jgi:hypothetical protein